MITHVYLRSVVFLLGLTALGKLAMALGDVPLLEEQSPVLSLLSNRGLLISAALLELGVALFICRAREESAALAAVAWLATLFVGYRAMLWVFHPQGSCHCLGNIAEVLRLSPAEANSAVLGLLAYFALGSCALLGRRWRGRLRNRQLPAGGALTPVASFNGATVPVSLLREAEASVKQVRS